MGRTNHRRECPITLMKVDMKEAHSQKQISIDEFIDNVLSTEEGAVEDNSDNCLVVDC